MNRGTICAERKGPIINDGSACVELVLLLEIPESWRVVLKKGGDIKWSLCELNEGTWFGTIEYFEYIGEFEEFEDDAKIGGSNHSDSLSTSRGYEKKLRQSKWKFKSNKDREFKKIYWDYCLEIEQKEATDEYDEVTFIKWNYQTLCKLLDE